MLDSTQPETSKSPVSDATLVTSIGLASTNAGLISGIFAGTAGDQTLYAATAAGASTAAAAFLLGLAIATFTRRGASG